MALHSLDDIEDGIEATKEFLLPFSWGHWLRLAVVVFFMGGVGGNVPSNAGQVGNFGGGPGGGSAGPGTGPSLPSSVGGMDPLVLIGAIATVVVLLVLVFGILGAVMEFVFVEALRTDEIHVRRYFRRHLGRGLRLFGFRLVVGLVFLLLLAGIGAGIFFGLFGGSFANVTSGQVLSSLLVILPLFLIVFVFFALVNGFTTTMVVPTMLHTDRTILSAWSRFWSTLRGDLKEYTVYALMVFVLHIAAGFITGIGLLLALIVLAIPFGILGFAIFTAAGGSFSLPVIAILGLLAAVFLVLLLLLGALVRVPIKAFFRYYALLVLGDTDPDLDLIPERRAEIRRPDPRQDRGGHQPPGDD